MYAHQQILQSSLEAGSHTTRPRGLQARTTSPSKGRLGPSIGHPAPVSSGYPESTPVQQLGCLEQMHTTISLNHHPDNLLFRVARTGKPSEVQESSELGGSSFTPPERTMQGPRELRPSHHGSFIRKRVPSTQKAMICDIPAPATSTPVLLRSSRELLTEPFRHARQRSLEKYLTSVRPKRVLGNLLQRIKKMSLEELTPNQLFKLMTETKLSAAAFQVLFCQRFELSRVLAELLTSVAPQLLVDKFGCHVLRRVCLASDRLMQAVCELTITQFCIHSKNEHSSRVMQTLAAVHPQYATACLRLISLHWRVLVEEVAVYYLICTCLKLVDSHADAFQRIGLHLRSQESKVYEFKHLKKILCVYLEFCRPSEVSRFYHGLDFESEFKRRRQDKLMANILRVLVQVRAFPAAVSFFEEISSRGAFVSETVDGFMLVQKILQAKSDVGDECGERKVTDTPTEVLPRPLPAKLSTDQPLSPKQSSKLASPGEQGSRLPAFGSATTKAAPKYNHSSIQADSIGIEL